MTALKAYRPKGLLHSKKKHCQWKPTIPGILAPFFCMGSLESKKTLPLSPIKPWFEGVSVNFLTTSDTVHCPSQGKTGKKNPGLGGWPTCPMPALSLRPPPHLNGSLSHAQFFESPRAMVQPPSPTPLPRGSQKKCPKRK